MRDFHRKSALRQPESFGRNSSNGLAPASSHPNLTSRLLVTAAAVLLVVASAGFGSLFAWQTGSKHDTALGVLSVAMALGLELSKPFAISSAFTTYRQLRIITATAMLFVGLLAVAYSLQAELTFMSMARGDLVAERAGEHDAASKAQARYQRAAAELASLPVARPAAVLAAQIIAIDVLPGITVDGKPCGGTINGPTTRQWCPKRAELVAEQARAERRSVLDAEMRDAERELKTAPAVAIADPGAVALATYLAALGVKTDSEKLGRWLPLIGVLALELGAAFSVVLVRSVTPSVVAQVAQPASTGDAVAQKPAQPVKARKQPRGRDDGGDDAGPPKRGLPGLLDAVRANGGVVDLSQRKLARRLGVPRTSLQRALGELAETGAVVLSSSANGTRIALA